MNTTHITNHVPLIGDFLGTIPAMVAKSEEEFGIDVSVKGSVTRLFEMIPPSARLNRISKRTYNTKFYDIRVGPNDTNQYQYATKHGLYMTQAHFHFLDLPVPSLPVRPNLRWKQTWAPTYDYLISPFSISLPPDQLWGKEQWKSLVEAMPNKTFGVLGARDNPLGYIQADNVWDEYGHDWNVVCTMMRQSKHGLISVITGTSHLAYALEVSNLILCGQDTPWGINPDALRVDGVVANIPVSRVLEHLR